MTEHFIVGYGTLLDKGSLGQTIGQDSADGKSYIPVLIKGYKRLFNLQPTHYTPGLKFSTDPIELAAANVEPSGQHEFNGLAFKVDESDLSALDQRERYYTRHSVQVYDFFSQALLGTGFTYSSDLDASWIVRDNALLLPLWRDLVFARNGAYGIDRAFGKKYDETTYMADGETLVIDYYQAHIGKSTLLSL
jgi:hypothetical protein